jgi:hypothetical protein
VCHATAKPILIIESQMSPTTIVVDDMTAGRPSTDELSRHATSSTPAFTVIAAKRTAVTTVAGVYRFDLADYARKWKARRVSACSNYCDWCA